ncbi:MAG: RNA-binding protein [Spirochaetales bacterium]|nr:RNA-binding protein [Spirochaetales bacterium]
MAKKIYVGNLSYNTGESALNDLFATHGEIVSTKLVSDQMTGRSKGFAFIEMANEAEAQAAIDALNGKEVDGRNIKVNEAIDRPRRNNY